MISHILCFVAGVGAVQQLTTLPDFYDSLVLLALTILLAWLRHWRLMLFISGMLWTTIFATLALENTLEPDLEGKEIVVQGYIDSLPEQDERKTRFDFIVTGDREDLPNKIRLNWYFPTQLIEAGQGWRLTVKLKRPRGLVNPGGFDYQRWLISQNIGAVGYVRSKPVPVLLQEPDVSQGFLFWRQVIADRLQHLAGEARHFSLIKALTIGDRSSMTQQEWDVFRKTGTAHLVAISGLHVGLVAGLVYFLVLKGWAYLGVLSFSPQKVAVVGALSAAFCYAGLAGFSLPTQRAVVMLTVVLLAVYWQRHIHPWKTLVLALFVVVVIDPWAVMSPSFWLSFTAVLLIVYTFSYRLGRFGYWRSLIKIHWLTAVGLAPLIMFNFQQVSLIAPVANFVAVPVISLLIVPLALTTVVVMLVSPSLAVYLLAFIEWILHGLWRFLTFCSDLPFASMMTAQPAFYAIWLAIAGIFLMFAPKGIPARYLGLVLCLPLIFVARDQPSFGEVRLTLLDVGQGLAAVVETANRVLVFDTGAKYSEQFDMGSAVVLPYLRYQGLDHIDMLLVSHGDNDHAGGVHAILESMPVSQIISSVPEMIRNHQAKLCRSGRHWRWDGVQFEVLSPPKQNYFQHDNDNSCVLRIIAGAHAMLLTGDIERTAEKWLVERYGNFLTSTILIAPHHGSDTSSSTTFLERVEPEVVLISSGYHNRFSFPAQQVLRRYRQEDIFWLDTAEDGAVIVSTDRETLLVEGSREKYKRYWFD